MIVKESTKQNTCSQQRLFANEYQICKYAQIKDVYLHVYMQKRYIHLPIRLHIQANVIVVYVVLKVEPVMA